MGIDEITIITGNSNIITTGESGSNTITLTDGNLNDSSVRGNTNTISLMAGDGNVVTTTRGTSTIEVFGGIDNVISGDIETYFISYQD